MAVKIRLRRMGSNKKPFFRVVVTDMRRPNEGRFLEALGWYDPKRKGVNFEIKADRIEHWQKKGAVVSDTVRSLLKKNRAEVRKAKPAPAPAVPAPDTTKAVPATGT
jgi:small subunit ribosomal protein S16